MFPFAAPKRLLTSGGSRSGRRVALCVSVVRFGSTGRKVVEPRSQGVRADHAFTFLFTDLESSTRLWEEHRDAMSDALAVHDELVRVAIEANGGRVVKT